MKLKCPIQATLIIFSLTLGLSLPLLSQEQRTTSEPVLSPRFGFKGGLNLSNLYVDDVEDENIKPGINIGLFAKIPVAKGFSIQPELLYTSKGSKIVYNSLFSTGEYRFNLNYVELPLLGVINVAKNFNLHAGAYVGYLASANIKEVREDAENPEIADLNEEDFDRFDYGLVGGLGVDVQNFTIGARYNYGLNQVGEPGSLAGQALRNSKNSVVTLYISDLVFKIKGRLQVKLAPLVGAF